MSDIYVHGVGVVSPAGWNLDSMRDALAKGEPLPSRPLHRPGWDHSFRVRTVPPLSSRPAFLSHNRLRRTSPITQFGVAAALEALGPDAEKVRNGSLRLAVVLCVMAGCVNYSRRFYDETLRDPGTASPMVFPETVFNAPASHLAALLGSTGMSYTLVGDPGMFLVGLALAADWLRLGGADGCVVVGAEESDWLIADAFYRFERKGIPSEGAGALYLRATHEDWIGPRLELVTDAHSFVQHRNRVQAAREMRAQLPPSAEGHLLCDSTQRLSKLDRAERDAWTDWTGARVSPKLVLGEGFAAGSAWQCAAAVDAIRQNRYRAATVSVVGCNQQAIGALFVNGRSY